MASIEIQPKTYPNGIAVGLDVVASSFSARATYCDLYCKLSDSEGGTLYECNILLDGEDFADWGFDNEYLVSFAAGKLEVNIVE